MAKVPICFFNFIYSYSFVSFDSNVVFLGTKLCLIHQFAKKYKIISMKLFYTLSIISLFVLVSCSENEVKEPKSDVIADFAVSGMTCKMGCGGSIRKGLLETGFVTQVDVDFDENNAENTISVHFDSNLIDEKQLLEVIESLNDGQFSAKFLTMKEISNAQQAHLNQEDQQRKNSSTIVEAKSVSFSIPNLTRLLNGLIY